MSKYIVSSIGRTEYYCTVEAGSQKDAIEKVKNGSHHEVNTVETMPKYRQKYSAKKQ
ncbi:hypothetical protein LCGC14_3139460 [marine sediment metagenome]|uniref:Uncharacterized protein n=1 Tax=marine sediment metagenome TaxID=412755 RepID=A0A0F8VXF3_9ZZZZ